MSLIVGFKCDGSDKDATEPCGGSIFCETQATVHHNGSSYISGTSYAKDLQTRLEQQGWCFLGGYCYCPKHSK